MSLIDENTSAIVINNPSNPCGSNFSRKHLRDIILISLKFKVPIICDEIYAHIVWGEGQVFTPLADIASKFKVPVITIGGLAKRFMVRIL